MHDAMQMCTSPARREGEEDRWQARVHPMHSHAFQHFANVCMHAHALMASAKSRASSLSCKAGLFMWQMVYPNNKVAKAKRDECIKLGVTEVRGRCMAGRGWSELSNQHGLTNA